VLTGAAQTSNVDNVIVELGRLWDESKKDLALGAVRDLLESVWAQNRALAQQNAELLRKAYGRSSERISPHQLALAFEEMRATQSADAPQPAADADVPNVIPKTSPKKKNNKGRRGRRPLPKDLPREVIRLVPEQAEQAGMTKVGEERSEILEFVPAQFKVIEYVRETWSNISGDIVTAAPPVKVIPKGMPGPGLLSQVVISKYRDCVPLARQCKIYKRSGVHLRRNTLVGWIKAAAFLLEPLAMRIYEKAMLARVLQVDDTYLPTLDHNKAKNIKRAHLWAMVGDKKYVAFRYAEDWTAARAEEFLKKRIGWMQIDAYAGYKTIAEGSLILLVGCWMHARRYCVKAFESHDVRAAEPLAIIKRMYKIEADSRAAGEDHDARLVRRQRELSPLLDELGEWKDKMKNKVPPSELLGKALTYLDNHWDILCVVEKDGALELDNGDVERVFRTPAMGRRNWLFAGSDAGGERAAVLMTILETAARQGIDLRAYLSDVLLKIAGGWKLNRLDELLPENWAGPAVAPAESPATAEFAPIDPAAIAAV